MAGDGSFVDLVELAFHKKREFFFFEVSHLDSPLFAQPLLLPHIALAS
jgi:hypothetical protein